MDCDDPSIPCDRWKRGPAPTGATIETGGHRSEGQIAIGERLKRFPTPNLLDPEPACSPIYVLGGLKHLPVRL
jgi:hypothetical protein